MIPFLKKYYIDLLFIILLGLFTYFLLVVRTPINMDEFSHYHPIICHHYENNELNIFREACGMYDQDILGSDISLPLRSYGYGGSLASIYYYPLFLIWQSPDSARMMGYLFIIIQAFILSRLLRFPLRYILLALVMFFPYFYQNVIDTSIIHFYTTAIFLSIYLIKKWFLTSSVRYIVIAGIAILLMLYSRLSFVFGLPALMLIFIYLMNKHKDTWGNNRMKMVKGFIIAIVVALIPFLIYALSPSSVTGDYPVLSELFGRESNNVTNMFDIDTYTNSQLLRRFMSPLEATERAYVMSKIEPIGLIYSALLFLSPILLYIYRVRKNKGKDLNMGPLIYYLGFIITILFLFVSEDTKHTHHAMMAYPFLILSWAYLIPDLKELSGKFFKILVIIFLLFNLYYFLTFTNNEIQIYDDPEINKLNEILNNDYLAQNYFYVIPNWGMYFYQGLYGPRDQSVIYIESMSDNTEVVERLKLYPEQYGKDLLFVYDKKVETVIPNLYNIEPDLIECSLTKDYEVWGILMPRGDDEDNPCR